MDARFQITTSKRSPELMQLFAVLIPKVQECQGQLRVHQVGDVMRSLEALTKNDEVTQLIAAVSSKVRTDVTGYYPPTGLGMPLQSEHGAPSWEETAAMHDLIAKLGPPPGLTVGTADETDEKWLAYVQSSSSAFAVPDHLRDYLHNNPDSARPFPDHFSFPMQNQ
jgi:hypothetical protein